MYTLLTYLFDSKTVKVWKKIKKFTLIKLHKMRKKVIILQR